jgi:phosphoadenosine phosphosulfate reductase
MNAAVSLLRPAPTNAATRPQLTDALRATVGAKSAATLALLREAVAEFGAHGELAFANSLGAEDMVLTDLIAVAIRPADRPCSLSTPGASTRKPTA